MSPSTRQQKHNVLYNASMSTLESGVVHEVPRDLRLALVSSKQIRESWNSLTPLARNEWICWTISVKKQKMRAEHIERLCYGITHGKRRPCCWPGCPHRRR